VASSYNIKTLAQRVDSIKARAQSAQVSTGVFLLMGISAKTKNMLPTASCQYYFDGTRTSSVRIGVCVLNTHLRLVRRIPYLGVCLPY
jgi:hypothetical protein